MRVLASDLQDTEALFFRILGRLSDWYADPVRARNFEGSGGHAHPSSKPLWLETDRGLQQHLDHWVWLWRRAKTERERVGVVQGVAFELQSFGRRMVPLDRVYRGTAEWRETIARQPGSLREVGARFDVSHQTVANFRKEFGVHYPDAPSGPAGSRGTAI